MAPETWKLLVDTHNDETSKSLVEILKRKGYEAAYNSSKKSKRVWLRESDIITDKVREIVRKHLKKGIMVKEDGERYTGLVLGYAKFLMDELPTKTFLE